MNIADIEANWNQIKGSVKEQFGKLTDDDIMQIEGKSDQLLGKLQERYNMTLEEAEAAIADMK
uniref:CsbD-like domain-containing protein n=1 Tax=uncultured Thiotrichaceae bacterium TaxID=298394 RepID=A0A6S6ULE7_9GAMM|nr:MAG: Unknown protein [uncultured Thiotrichaceae bacterium]